MKQSTFLNKGILLLVIGGVILFLRLVHRPKGTAPRNVHVLVERLCKGSDPACSPDGKGIAFIESHDDNSGRTQEILKLLMFPGKVKVLGPIDRGGPYWCTPPLFWLPDSSQIVFSYTDDSGRPIRLRLYALSIESRAVEKIGTVTGYRGCLSPDGKKVATFRFGPGGVCNIWVSNVDGTKASPLTDFRTGTCSVVGSGFPRWSADGKWIAFSRKPTDLPRRVLVGNAGTMFNHLASEVQRKVLHQVGIWRVRTRDKRLERITDNENDTTPIFSPNSKELAFDRNGGLCVAEIGTGRVKRLTDVYSHSVTWTPKGDRLIFDSIDGWIYSVDLRQGAGGLKSSPAGEATPR